MPELPEVETTVQGLKPYILGKNIQKVIFYRENLRYSLNKSWKKNLLSRTIVDIKRRAKFLIIKFEPEYYAVWHLGMSGSLRLDSSDDIKRLHDHIEWQFADFYLRYHDPRRFGFLKCYAQASEMLADLAHYGIEPLGSEFTGQFLFERAANKTMPIKNFIMDQSIVVGVGNIYACEALFQAKISPNKAAKLINLAEYNILVESIKNILRAAITKGGTTLKDFVNPHAQAGYFAQELNIYGRKGEACYICQTIIHSIKLAGRSSFYCPHCQN